MSPRLPLAPCNSTTAGGKEVGALGRGEGRDQGADGVPQGIDCALGGLSQQCLELGKRILDRIEIGAVGRQVEEHGSDRLNGGAHGASLVAAEVVHDHDVAGPEFGNENLIDIGLESVAVDRPVEDHRRHHPGQAKPGDEGGRPPMAMRDAGAQSFAPRGAPAQPRHVGGGPRLVDEHQPFGIEIGLTVEPGLAPLYDVRTIPLRGVGGLFLYVRPQRSRNVHRVARAARTPRSARSRASSSLIVRSGVAVIKPRM